MADLEPIHDGRSLCTDRQGGDRPHSQHNHESRLIIPSGHQGIYTSLMGVTCLQTEMGKKLSFEWRFLQRHVVVKSLPCDNMDQTWRSVWSLSGQKKSSRSILRFSSFVAMFVGAIFAAHAGEVTAEPKASQVTVTGNFREAGRYASLIFLNSLNGDLSRSGLILRLSFGSAGLDLPDDGLSTTSAALLPGYQIVAPTLRTRIFAGVDMKNRDFSISGLDEGTHTGARVMVQLSQGRESDVEFDIHASYTTIQNAYNLLARVSWPTVGASLGPEFAILGSDDYKSTRLAVAFNDWRVGSLNATVRAGYAFGSDDEGRGDSPFLAISLTQQF
jgi:hypothetical protein